MRRDFFLLLFTLEIPQASMSSSSLRVYCKVLVVDPPTLVKLDVAPSATVLSVLQRIECGEPAANLALVHEGDELRTDATLEGKGISNNATLHVICTKRTLRLRAPSDSPAAHPPAALARRLRLDAARSRKESLVDLQRARTVETIVPSATPGALQQRLNEAASSTSAIAAAAAAAAAASDSDSEEGAADDGDDEDEDEVDEASGGAEAVLPRATQATLGSRLDTRERRASRRLPAPAVGHRVHPSCRPRGC